MDSLEVEVNTLDAALAKLNWEIAQQIDSINIRNFDTFVLSGKKESNQDSIDKTLEMQDFSIELIQQIDLNKPTKIQERFNTIVFYTDQDSIEVFS